MSNRGLETLHYWGKPLLRVNNVRSEEWQRRFSDEILSFFTLSFGKTLSFIAEILKSCLKSATRSGLDEVMVRFVVIAFRTVSCIKCCSCVSTLHPRAVKFKDNACEMGWNMEILQFMQSNEWYGTVLYLSRQMMTLPFCSSRWTCRSMKGLTLFRENHNNTRRRIHWKSKSFLFSLFMWQNLSITRWTLSYYK